MHFDNSQPIWLQLVAEFSRRIAIGIWPPASRIPGVRELAGDLKVNPNTVQRSLSELEREGLCRVERGSGRFVTSDNALIETIRRRLAADATKDFIQTAKGLHINAPEAVELINEYWNEQWEQISDLS